MATGRRGLSLRTKLGFGAGDLFGGGASTLISMYYMFFLTTVVGISPSLAGTAFLISKIWDAVTDPFMGVISDNTRTKLGRRRPYFLAGVVLIFVSFVLMWAPMPIAREGMKFLYVLITYLFFSTVYTLVMVPFNAIATELTSDFDERTTLSTYRMVFSNVSGVLAGVLGYDVFVKDWFPEDAQTGFFVMSIAFGLLFALPYLATFFWCKEDPELMNAPRRRIGSIGEFLRDNLVEPLRLRPFRFVVFMFLFGFMAQDAVMALAVYFISGYLKVDMMTLLVPVYGCMIVAIPFVDMLAGRLGKRSVYLISCVLWVVSFVLVPFIQPGSSAVLIYVFGALFGAAAAGIQVMVFAMLPDIPDADELFSGTNREGLYSGMSAFLRKAGGALVMFLIGILLDAFGFHEPEPDAALGILPPQTPDFLRALVWMLVGIPVLFIIIAAISCRMYPLTKSVHERLRALLLARKAGPLSAEMQAEEAELKRILGRGKD